MKRYPEFVYNAIDKQNIVFANQLKMSDWNNIINVLKTQANANTTFLETWTRWFFGPKEYIDEDEYAIVPDGYISYFEYLTETFISFRNRINEEKKRIDSLNKALSDEATIRDTQDQNLADQITNLDNKKLNKNFDGIPQATAIHRDDTIIIKCEGNTLTVSLNTLAKLLSTEVDYFKGYHTTLEALQKAHPTGEPGDYAFVGSKDEDQYVMYIWDAQFDRPRWEETTSGQYVLTTVFDDFQKRLQEGSVYVGAVKGNQGNVPESADVLSDLEINGSRYLVPSVVVDFFSEPQEGAYTLGSLSINGDVWNISAGNTGGSSVDSEALEEVKTYAETLAESTLKESKDYADSKNVETITNANTYSDLKDAETLGSAKTYADTKSESALNEAKAYTDSIKDSILGKDISETFDTLKEIQDWIQNNGVDATELSQAVATLTSNITKLTTDLATANTNISNVSSTVANKQDKLKPGTGITIGNDGTISVSFADGDGGEY